MSKLLNVSQALNGLFLLLLRIPKRKHLSGVECGKILGMKVFGMSEASIAKSVRQRRSKAVFNNFFKDSSKYGKVKSTGRHVRQKCLRFKMLTIYYYHAQVELFLLSSAKRAK